MLYKNELIAALLKEIRLQKDYLEGELIESVYFGGGTPSLFQPEELNQLMQQIFQEFPMGPDTEITIEANPDDINADSLREWKKIKINRLSIGVQSFFEEDLRWMNRVHSASQALESVQEASKVFDNITLDLIYGTPSLTNEKWKYNVEQAIGLGIPHLSCYALTVESKTPLDKMIRLKQTEKVDPDKQSDQFLMLMDWMNNAGYEHYEISSFAKPGWKSRHNSSYWQGKKYLGLGPSAHSFNGNSRQWNVANNQLYISSLNKDQVPFEKEELTDKQKLNEYIMTSLRTMEGMDLRITGESLIEKSRKYRETGLMNLVDNKLVLTNPGKLLADGIAADLFF